MVLVYLIMKVLLDRRRIEFEWLWNLVRVDTVVGVSQKNCNTIQSPWLCPKYFMFPPSIDHRPHVHQDAKCVLNFNPYLWHIHIPCLLFRCLFTYTTEWTQNLFIYLAVGRCHLRSAPMETHGSRSWLLKLKARCWVTVLWWNKLCQRHRLQKEHWPPMR